MSRQSLLATAAAVGVLASLPMAGMSAQIIELKTNKKCLVKYQPVGEIAEVQWSGKCEQKPFEKGGKFAHGRGVLEIKYSALGTDRFDGEMQYGELVKGRMTYGSAGAVQFDGYFSGGAATGKLFHADGKPLYDGNLSRSWWGGPPPFGFMAGRLHLTGGGYAHGTFAEGAMPERVPPDMEIGGVHDNAGVLKERIVRGKVATPEEYALEVSVGMAFNVATSRVHLARTPAVITDRQLEPLRYRSRENCLVSPYPLGFTRRVIAALSWSGACKDGKAEGAGILTVNTSNGTDRYEGRMTDGELNGTGQMTWESADRVRFVGSFVLGAPLAGKFYDSTGTLLFDGALYGTWRGGSAPYGFNTGRWYETGGSYVFGEFPATALGNGATAPQSNWGVSFDKDGVARDWTVGRERYATTEGFFRAQGAHIVAISDSVSNSNNRMLADINRQSAAFQADLQRREEQQRQQELERQRKSERSGQLISGIIGAVAEGVIKANTPPPPPAPAPPSAGGYTPPPRVTPPAPPAPPPDYRDRQEVIASNGRPALDCVRVLNLGNNPNGNSNRVFSNGCSDVVTVTWCYTGGECERGGGNTWNIHPGKSWPLQPNGELQWFACHGADTVHKTREAGSFKYYCTAPDDR